MPSKGVNKYWWARYRSTSRVFHAIKQELAPWEPVTALCSVQMSDREYQSSRTDLNKIPDDARGCPKCLRIIERGE